MAYAWRCRRCKGPHPPLPGGPDGKPWLGPCPNCGGSYDGERVSVAEGDVDGAEVQPIMEGEVMSLSDAITVEASNPEATIVIGSPGFDWILGNGLPSGIGVLLASPAGGGKSTLIVETFRKLALRKLEALYICTEETVVQMGRRYARLGKFPPHFQVVHMTDIDEILELLERRRPRVAAVDSLHDITGVKDSNDFSISTGSPSAVTLAAKAIRKLANAQDTTIFTVSHVTKAGGVAGSNDLQHEMDMTLYLNGRQKVVDGMLKIVGVERTLRCAGKNRFADTERMAHFQMQPDGLHDRGPWMYETPPWEPRLVDG